MSGIDPDECDPDCEERAACDVAGDPGHWQCGECADHDMPRHHCGCFALKEAVQ